MIFQPEWDLAEYAVSVVLIFKMQFQCFGVNWVARRY